MEASRRCVWGFCGLEKAMLRGPAARCGRPAAAGCAAHRTLPVARFPQPRRLRWHRHAGMPHRATPTDAHRPGRPLRRTPESAAQACMRAGCLPSWSSCRPGPSVRRWAGIQTPPRQCLLRGRAASGPRVPLETTGVCGATTTYVV